MCDSKPPEQLTMALPDCESTAPGCNAMVAWVHCKQKGMRLGKRGMQQKRVFTYREERPHLVIAEGGADWKIPAW